MWLEVALCVDPKLEDVFNSMTPPFTRDQWHIHDPSRVVAVSDDLLMIANTGKAQEDGYKCGLETWIMTPGDVDWRPGQCLLVSKPSWIDDELPGNDGAFWAPTLLNSTFMYYSVASMDRDAQCIGMARATGKAPEQEWVDSGAPITCSFDPESEADRTNEPNSIDPAVFADTSGSEPRQYLVYGGNRIWVTELNPANGRQIKDNWWDEKDRTYHYLAKGPPSFDDPDETEWIEAPFIYSYDSPGVGKFYYLFVNWYGCCDGIDSTYEIHVGRSDSITGPYVDKSGVEMTGGSGSLLLQKEGRFIGPGHTGILEEGGRHWISYHFYDGDRDGLPWVDMRRLMWDVDGWPTVLPQQFNATAYFEDYK